MPGGAVRLAGLGAGTPSRPCHQDPLFWPLHRESGVWRVLANPGHRDDSEWRGLGQCLLPATVSPGWRRCRVRPVCPGCWAWTDVALFHSVTRQYTAHCVTLLHGHTWHTVLHCYIATPGTLCYTVTLPDAHCVMLQYTYCIVHRAHMYRWQATSCYIYTMAHCHITCVTTQCNIVH